MILFPNRQKKEVFLLGLWRAKYGEKKIKIIEK
jgi:hypothetical protein